MTEHPSAIDLEEWFATRAPGAIEAHIAGCESCSQYITALEAQQQAFLQGEPDQAFLRRPQIAAELQRPAEVTTPFWRRLRWPPLMAAAAAAAAIAVAVMPADQTQAPQPSIGPDIIRLKGARSLAVIIKRGASQTRVQGRANVQPGDQLRVEVTLATAQELKVGVLLTTGEWVPLYEGRLDAGAHVVHQDALEVDENETVGWVLAGPAEAVDEARRGGSVALTQGIDGLTSLALEWGD